MCVFVRNPIRGSGKRTDTMERNPGEWKDYGRGKDRDKAVCYEDDLQFARAGAGNKAIRHGQDRAKVIGTSSRIKCLIY